MFDAVTYHTSAFSLRAMLSRLLNRMSSIVGCLAPFARVNAMTCLVDDYGYPTTQAFVYMDSMLGAGADGPSWHVGDREAIGLAHGRIHMRCAHGALKPLPRRRALLVPNPLHCLPHASGLCRLRLCDRTRRLRGLRLRRYHPRRLRRR